MHFSHGDEIAARLPLQLRLSLAAIAMLAALGCATGQAWALGELTQKPGTAGCIAEVTRPPSSEELGECTLGRGFASPVDVAVSPDGKSVYVLASQPQLNASMEVEHRGQIAIFDRDPATGALTQRPGATGCLSEIDGKCGPAEAMTEPVAIAVAPDGKNVYVLSAVGIAAGTTGEHGVLALFNRDPLTGALSQSQDESGCIAEEGRAGPPGARIRCRAGHGLGAAPAGLGGLALSSDGNSLYVAGSNEVAIFARDSEGVLTQHEEPSDCISANGKDGAGRSCVQGAAIAKGTGIVVSPDGKNVYATERNTNAVLSFTRHADGGLEQEPGAAGCISGSAILNCEAGRLLDKPTHLVLSPNGQQLYVTGASALTIFDRDAATGQLHQRGGPAGCLTPPGEGECQSARSFIADMQMALSPDGSSIYAVLNSIIVFDRDLTAGGVTQKAGAAGCITHEGQESCERGRPLGEAQAASVVSPDGRNLYSVGSFEQESGARAGMIAIFDRAVPGVPSAQDTLAPVVSGFKLIPGRFQAAGKGHRSSFVFALSERANVSIGIQRGRPGRRVGKTCRPPSQRHAKHRPCIRFVPIGTLRYPNRPDAANKIPFAGKLGKRILTPGRYRAVLIATDAAGNSSTPKKAAFSVLMRHR